MKAMLLCLVLLAGTVAFVPTASADMCYIANPTADAVVCGVYNYAGCLTHEAPKGTLQRIAMCDVSLLA